MTTAQQLTVEALTPVEHETDVNVQGYSVKMPGTVMVQFLGKGVLQFVYGQYVIHPGGSYVGAGTAIPEAWYDPTQYHYEA